MSFSKEHRSATLSGILFVALFAVASLYLSEISWLARAGINSLVIAIILGILYSNTLRHHLPERWTPGVLFSAKQLLRLAIILYGFRVSFQQIAAVGLEGFVIDAFVVALTLFLGYWVGVKLFKLDRHLALLISTGSAICGAAAVLAVEDVLHSEAYKATIAVGTVVLFGTISMFLYPMFQHAGVFNFTDNQYGIFAGAAVHEVAQALVAGANVSVDAGNTAVIVKMTRVLMLIPVLLLLSVYENHRIKKVFSGNSAVGKIKLNIPWFAVIFAGAIAFNSLHILPQAAVRLINQWDIFFLTMAMAAIGMETNLQKIKKVGLKPFYFAIFLFLWLMVSVFFLVKFF